MEHFGLFFQQGNISRTIMNITEGRKIYITYNQAKIYYQISQFVKNYIIIIYARIQYDCPFKKHNNP
jgi:hypothetical protein